MIQTGLIAPAILMQTGDRQQAGDWLARPGQDKLAAPAAETPRLQHQARTGVLRRRGQRIDQTVQRIGTIERRSRTAHHFHPARQRTQILEQTVHIGKAGRAQGHAVFQIEKGSGAGTASEDRRTDRRQVFSPIAAMDEDASLAVEQLGRVLGRNTGNLSRIDHPDRKR